MQSEPTSAGFVTVTEPHAASPPRMKLSIIRKAWKDSTIQWSAYDGVAGR
jgi:hypothetical protein